MWLRHSNAGGRARSRRTRLRGASTPSFQSLTTAHCAGKASLGTVGSPAASMPRCRCRKESHRCTLSTRACSSAASAARTLPAAPPPTAPPPTAASTSLRVLHRSALLMTALRAITRRPSAVATPTQRRASSSMSSCDTCVFRWRCEPSCLVTPRTSAATMACVPPLGKSSATPGR